MLFKLESNLELIIIEVDGEGSGGGVDLERELVALGNEELHATRQENTIGEDTVAGV